MNKNLNEVVLRPRFKLKINAEKEVILKSFEKTKTLQNNFIVSRVDDHVFIKIPKAKQHFWSPQLHLEINNNDTENSSTIFGLFGPNPTVWTLFMFLHFTVAGLFIAFCVWAYTNYTLKADYSLQIWGIFLMVILWFVLYFSGRISKASNKSEMNDLHNFMEEVIHKKASV